MTDSAISKRTAELTSYFRAAGAARDEKSVMKTIFEMNNRFFNAPVVVYVCMDCMLSQWSVFDPGAVSQSTMPAAQEYGVDSAVAFMPAAYPDLIRAELNIPGEIAIVIGIAPGYRDADHPANQYRGPRRPFGDVARFKGVWHSGRNKSRRRHHRS